MQRDSSSRLVKQMISYAIQAAAVDIFHEILNANSILFVGAVLKDMPGKGVGLDVSASWQCQGG